MSIKTELDFEFETPIHFEKLTYFGGLGIEKSKTPKEVLANIEFYDPMGRNLKTDFEKIADKIKSYTGIVFLVGRNNDLLKVIFILEDGFYEINLKNVTSRYNLNKWRLNFEELAENIKFGQSRFYVKQNILPKFKGYLNLNEITERFVSNPKRYMDEATCTNADFNNHLFKFAKAIVNWD